MTTLDFTEAEPTLSKKTAANKEMFSGNAAIYERLQGRTKKTGLAKYSWVALPVGVVAVIGIVAATSTPNRSADNIAAGPVDAKPAMIAAAAPTPADVNPTPAVDATPAQVHSAIAAAPVTSQSAPAPVHLARRAAAPASTDTRPAAATRPQSVPAASLTPAPTVVNPPVAAAPAPAAADPVIAAPAPVISAPAPVETAPAPAAADPAPAAP